MPGFEVPDAPVRASARRQSAALPVVGSGAAMRVVLVTSRETRRWVLPKGWIKPSEAPHHGAAREAFEEAGLVGECEPEPFGIYTYEKRLPRGVLTTEVLVFRLLVAERLADWPERGERERRLFSPAEAASLVQEPGLAELLRRLSPE